jgi:hypothetical protein
MSGEVVEKLGDCLSCGFGASCLSGVEGTKGIEHDGIDGASVE